MGFDPVSYLMGMKAGGGGGGGGGNPNYVETIEGTLATVFSNTQLTYQEIDSDFNTNQLSAYIVLSLPDFGGGEDFRFSLSEINSAGPPPLRYAIFEAAITKGQAALLYFNHSKEFNENSSVYTNDEFGTGNIPATTPCTLRIIHHPLPDSGT